MAVFKNVIVAHKAQINPHVGGSIDILGAFDNMIQPMFPYPMENLSIILTFEEIFKPTIFEVRLNSPADELITKGEFQPMVDPFGVGKKILDLEKMLIKDRGIYTIDIFEKVENEVKFLASSKLFIADFPPQRPITPEIKEAILKTEGVVKSVKTEFRPMDNPDQLVKIQISLDSSELLEEGYTAMPLEDKITLDGKEYDLTGIRRQVEWMYGNPIPKNEEMKEEAVQA
ncbi:MAG: hypothetical protein ACRCUA_06210 [Fusobacteriaceae bacterium]